jgi:hypothetical protein
MQVAALKLHFFQKEFIFAGFDCGISAVKKTKTAIGIFQWVRQVNRQ